MAKNGVHANDNRGKTPMEKNIAVTDESGKIYGVTYPKRAKGLVKHGRARFIDDNTICLACPPNKKILEDDEMSENYINETAIPTEEQIKLQPEPAEAPVPGTITAEALLSRIDRIIENTAYIKDAFAILGSIEPVSDHPDYANQSRATALGEIVTAREATNQQTIRLLEKMYDDVKPDKVAKNVTGDTTVQFKQLFETFLEHDYDVPEQLIEAVSRSIMDVAMFDATSQRTKKG